MSDNVSLVPRTERGSLAGSRIVSLILYVRDLNASRDFYEGSLGLEPFGYDGHSVAYDTGQTVLRLKRASDEDIVLPARDDSADVTFLVKDLDKVRRELAEHAVECTEPLRYQIGATTGFHDPDGHKLSLYEPSEAALTWPSAAKLRAVQGGSAARGGGLRGCAVVYLFLFVPDAEEAFGFYHDTLGLEDLECRACRRGSTEHPRGVVKYDTGGLMLTTHLVEGARPMPDARQVRALAPIFQVAELDPVVRTLARAGVRCNPVARLGSENLVSFEDPIGRRFYLQGAVSLGSPRSREGR